MRNAYLPSMEVIGTRGLSKSFGLNRALDQISLSIGSGEIYGFLGLNGAGKTTLIRSLLGMINPDQGQIHLFGRELNPKFDQWNKIGYLVESAKAYPELTVAENLKVFGLLRRIKVPALEADAIERLKLAPYRNTKSKALSLGNLQRLGLAKALFHKPALLILDEPTNGLDPEGIVEIRNLLLDMARTGTTIFISSHILAEISRLADRIGIIHKGKLVRELHAHELNRQRTTSLRLRTRDNPKAREALLNQGFPAIQIHPSWIEIKDERAIQNPSSLTRWLSLQDLPPEEIYIFKEDLEHFFLRTLQIENQDD
ncbi:MAG TPA: ABC transporter ATP-binding protein [Saprospiraceae bacterium]|nr:ABC transporter ATP-binding protein [Saprospiraceae bacterium]